MTGIFINGEMVMDAHVEFICSKADLEQHYPDATAAEILLMRLFEVKCTLEDQYPVFKVANLPHDFTLFNQKLEENYSELLSRVLSNMLLDDTSAVAPPSCN